MIFRRKKTITHRIYFVWAGRDAFWTNDSWVINHGTAGFKEIFTVDGYYGPETATKALWGHKSHAEVEPRQVWAKHIASVRKHNVTTKVRG